MHRTATSASQPEWPAWARSWSEASYLAGVHEGMREHVSLLADNALYMRYVELHTEGIVTLRKGLGS